MKKILFLLILIISIIGLSSNEIFFNYNRLTFETGYIYNHDNSLQEKGLEIFPFFGTGYFFEHYQMVSYPQNEPVYSDWKEVPQGINFNTGVKVNYNINKYFEIENQLRYGFCIKTSNYENFYFTTISNYNIKTGIAFKYNFLDFIELKSSLGFIISSSTQEYYFDVVILF